MGDFDEMRRLVGQNFNVKYQAILDKATLEGYTKPSEEQQILQNQFVIDLVDNGIWDKLDMLHVWAVDTPSGKFGRINWINPDLFLADSSAGFVANKGIAGIKIGTGFIPSLHAIKMTAANCSYGFRIADVTVDDMGTNDYSIISQGTSGILNSVGTLARVYMNSSAETYNFPIATYGKPCLPGQFTIFTKTGIANKYIKDGVTAYSVNRSMTYSLADAEVFYNSNSAGFSNLHSLYFLGEDFTAAEALTFNNIFNNYLDAL